MAGRGDLYGELGVIGANADGGYAEKCLVPETHLYQIPHNMTWHQAVMFPTVWMTSHHALFDIAKLKAGETVMIHAAGSGVSMAGIQWAKNAGAIVLATAGSEGKCAKALELGADFACNNRETDIAGWVRGLTDGKGVDVVFDHVGEAIWAASIFSLAPRGRLVNCGNTSGDAPVIPSLGYMFHMGIQLLGSDPYRYEEFGRAWKQYCESDFKPIVDSVFSLSEGAQAQEKLSSGKFFGKIISDSSPSRRLSIGPSISGIMSPAFLMMTVSFNLICLRSISSGLCRLARETTDPAISTGAKIATGVIAPVRPT
jgi:NADPH:quinone reductase-like Zn-dependent oxidoreductase